MSMADEYTVRPHRSNDTPRRAGGSASEHTGNSDPLSELARLIGQSDPFAEFGKGSPRSSERVASAPTTGGYDWRKAAAAMPPYETQPELGQGAPDERHGFANSDYSPAGY